MSTILEVQNVRKVFEKNVAVNDISLQINEGVIFGLLGPNGAGKTTLIRMITNILYPDSGVIKLNGHTDGRKRMMQIGYMPEERGLYKKMKVGEQLMYLAQLKNLSYNEAENRIKKWLVRFDITDWYNKKVEDLSKGMQQKIQFISTVLHEPNLIILDEPFSGLDPVNTNLIRDEIYRLKQEGATIVFSTHRMEQVEQICEEIALINQGNKILQGSVKQVKQEYKLNQYELEFNTDTPTISSEAFEVLTQNENKVTIQLHEGFNSKAILNSYLNADADILNFSELLPSLNDIFIRKVQA
ncbi:UNVERIFIED_CONTAM: hypothetical protein GTU68_061714 [Idotea baltica]|nr:hypothetical protein [Idotea baltica]